MQAVDVIVDLEDLAAKAPAMSGSQRTAAAAPKAPTLQHSLQGNVAAAEHAEPGIQIAPHGLAAAAEHAELGIQTAPSDLKAAAEHAELGIYTAHTDLKAAAEHADPIELGIRIVPQHLQPLGSQQAEVARLVQAAASMHDAELSTEPDPASRLLMFTCFLVLHSSADASKKE